MNLIDLPGRRVSRRRFLQQSVVAALGSARLLDAALPASDAFTATNGTYLYTYSGNWTNGMVGSADFRIYDNQCKSNDPNFDSFAWWNADQFYPDQYVEGVIGDLNTDWIGIGVRVSANNGFFLKWNATGYEMQKYVSGTQSVIRVLTGFSPTANAGQTMRLEAFGNRLVAYHNGSVIGTVVANDHTSGAAAVFGSGTGSTSNTGLESWTAGNLKVTKRKRFA